MMPGPPRPTLSQRNATALSRTANPVANSPGSTRRCGATPCSTAGGTARSTAASDPAEQCVAPITQGIPVTGMAWGLAPTAVGHGCGHRSPRRRSRGDLPDARSPRHSLTDAGRRRRWHRFRPAGAARPEQAPRPPLPFGGPIPSVSAGSGPLARAGFGQPRADGPCKHDRSPLPDEPRRPGHPPCVSCWPCRARVPPG